MNFRLTSTAFLSLFFTSMTQANVFEFSYKFTDTNDIISGYFSGTANGDLITNLSDITLYLDGTAIPTDSSGSMYNASLQNGVYQLGNAQLSFDGLQNNAIFVDIAGGFGSAIPNAEFVASNTARYGDFIEFSKNFFNGANETALFYQINSTITTPETLEYNTADWSVISAMPIPSSFWLFGSVLAGLGLIKNSKQKLV